MRFWGLQKSFFFIVKRGFFPLHSYYEALFLVLFWPNLSEEKIWHFCPKAWVNPFEKIRFFGLKKIRFFLMPKKVFFFSSKSKSISSSLILIKSKSRRKLHFFWQGYELTPLKKWDFLEFEKFCFFKVKKDFFFLCKVTKHYF